MNKTRNIQYWENTCGSFWFHVEFKWMKSLRDYRVDLKRSLLHSDCCKALQKPFKLFLNYHKRGQAKTLAVLPVSNVVLGYLLNSRSVISNVDGFVSLDQLNIFLQLLHFLLQTLLPVFFWSCVCDNRESLVLVMKLVPVLLQSLPKSSHQTFLVI